MTKVDSNSRMISLRKKPNRILWLCLGVAGAIFLAFFWINRFSSENLAMVSMFEPDEGVLIPYIRQMVAPASGIFQFLHQFVFYDYYFYGFPFFALSALVALLLRLAGLLDQMPVLMVFMRQFISVLPMILAILLLIFMQDGFKTYRSPILLVFLLSIPAVLRNNLWWHPDGLTILFAILTLYFLNKDELRFGKSFLLAAFFTGLATAIKLVGLYFFLAVGLTLILGIITKRASVKRIIGMSFAFIGIMVVTYIISNPFLLSHWARDSYLQIFRQQTQVLSEGYGVVYAKGIAAALPSIRENYGGLLLFAIPLGCAIWGAVSGKKRLLYALILAWFLPLTVTIFFFSHFKFQYWLPVTLPIFSCAIMLLPEQLRGTRWFQKENLLRTILLAVMVVQFGRFILTDGNILSERISRAENNPRIEFYDSASTALASLEGQALNVYYDYRLYMPGHENWTTSSTFDLLNYDFIQKNNFDVLMLLNQRIKDYINPGVQGIDPAQFVLSQQFYRDADAGQIKGYRMLLRDATGSIFIRDALFQDNFQK